MPIYDYVCSACEHRLEVIHGVDDAGPRFCPECGSDGTMKKAFVPPAIHFKGSGWAKKDRSATSTPGTSSKVAKAKDETSAAATTSGGDATASPASSSASSEGS